MSVGVSVGTGVDDAGHGVNDAWDGEGDGGVVCGCCVADTG